MSISTATLWLVIAGLAFGSWLLRFSFLGIIGNKELPEWVKRHLRYTACGCHAGHYRTPGFHAARDRWGF